jgi:hypothetical protein
VNICLFINIAGYLLLAGRCRRVEDANVVAQVLQTYFKRTIDIQKLFSLQSPYLLLDVNRVQAGLLWI